MRCRRHYALTASRPGCTIRFRSISSLPGRISDTAPARFLLDAMAGNRVDERAHGPFLGLDVWRYAVLAKRGGAHRTDHRDGHTVTQSDREGFAQAPAFGHQEQVADLRRTGEGYGIDGTIGHPIDQLGDLVVIGRVGIDVRQDGVGLRTCLPQEIGEFGLVGRRHLHTDQDPAIVGPVIAVVKQADIPAATHIV